MRRFTTREVARIVGVSRVTIQKWIRQGRIKAPTKTFQGRRAVRLWSPTAVREVSKLKEQKDAEREFWRRVKVDALKSKKTRRKVPRQAKLDFAK